MQYVWFILHRFWPAWNRVQTSYRPPWQYVDSLPIYISFRQKVFHIPQETNDRNSPASNLFSIPESIWSHCAEFVGSPCKDRQEINYAYTSVMCLIYLFTSSMLGHGFSQSLDIRHQPVKSYILTPKCSTVDFSISARCSTSGLIFNPVAKQNLFLSIPTVRMWTTLPSFFYVKIWSQSDHICKVSLTCQQGLH